MKPRIPVMHLRDSSGIFGAERVILTLAKNIDKDKFEFTLLCMRRGDGKSDMLISKAQKLGVNVISVDVKGKTDFRSVLSIRKILLKNNIKILHSHDFKSDLYGLLATINAGIKRVSTAHGSTRDSFLKKVYLFIDEDIVYRFFTRIIVVSIDLNAFLRRKKINKNKIQIIQNGLDLELLWAESALERTPPLPKTDGKKVFAVVGRLFPDKGHKFFLNAFSRLYQNSPEIVGLIIGDGPIKNQIAAWIEELNLGNSVFLCGVRNDMKNVYELIDFLVIPSLTEGLPYVLLEAMASKVPVLATSVGDIPKLIIHKKTGFLVEPGDENELQNYMMWMIKNSKKTERMAINANNMIRKNFSARKMTEATENLYLSILPS